MGSTAVSNVTHERGVDHALLELMAGDGLVPAWIVHTDWRLEEFHRTFTETGWPSHVKDLTIDASVGAHDLGWLTDGDNPTLGVPLSTVAALRRTLAVFGDSFARPATYQPAELMPSSEELLQQAALKLRLVGAMMWETGYCGWPDDFDPAQSAGTKEDDWDIWRPTVITAVRFMYYHELGHAVIHQLGINAESRPRIRDQSLTGAEREEAEADCYSWALTRLETQKASNHSLAGAVLALTLIAAREIATPSELFSWESTHKRMRALLEYAAPLAKHDSSFAPDFELGLSVARHFAEILNRANCAGPLFSPVGFALSLVDELGSPTDPRRAARLLATWKAFGDRHRLRRSIVRELRERLTLANGDANATLLRFEPLLGELAKYEPMLGLSCIFRGPW